MLGGGRRRCHAPMDHHYCPAVGLKKAEAAAAAKKVIYLCQRINTMRSMIKQSRTFTSLLYAQNSPFSAAASAVARRYRLGAKAAAAGAGAPNASSTSPFSSLAVAAVAVAVVVVVAAPRASSSPWYLLGSAAARTIWYVPSGARIRKHLVDSWTRSKPRKWRRRPPWGGGCGAAAADVVAAANIIAMPRRAARGHALTFGV